MVLASASPRRAGLLKMAGLEFDVSPPDIDESRQPGEPPLDFVHRLAREKALARTHPGRPVLAADTMVFIGDRVFDKPSGPEEAARHLRDLSGQTHNVVTAFCLAENGDVLSLSSVLSRVTFRRLTEREIANYVATGEGLDKAGAYGLQGDGGFLIETIEGSHTNVIGLPMTEVLAVLNNFGRASFASEALEI
ncbi:septum formation protein Maf [Deltaproteobacteria bacterium Smac51]|nr:septum formation protein Maf [Deltaproteobacteria bacterium Smac51]